jgi:phenylpropionate dioxygenase-like ring-hydroxylating dioxygenase large terminal subunit
MRRDVYEAIAQQLPEHAKSRTTDSNGAVKAVPVAHYRDRSRWLTEVKKVFKEMPVLVALSCELKNAADYKAVEIVGVPLLIIRGEDGSVAV